jgi:hypothetical protein
MQRLVERGAGLACIGQSVRGEPLFALELGKSAGVRSNGEGGITGARTTTVVAGLHPLEWIGIETALTLVDRLLDGGDLGERNVFAVPIANPDGLLHVERNLRRRRRRFVRHNARGVDLNRNFDVHWGHRSIAARFIPWVFRPGSHPASEPEVAAIGFALGARRVDRALSLHSFGGVVLYPSSHSRRRIADRDEHRDWARRIARAADTRPYFTMSSSWFGLGMTMGGLEIDWFHERHGAVSLLVECSRGGFSLRPSRLFDPFAWFNPRNPDPVAERLARALEPFARGDAI